MIQFLTLSPIVAKGDKLYSDLASVRYRVIPAMYAMRWHEVAVGGHPVGDLIVISKSTDPAHEQVADRHRVVFDLCDDWFNHPHFGDRLKAHTVAMCQKSVAVVTSTQTLAARILAEAGVTATVISDPVEGPRGTPKSANPDHLDLLWFGHQGNWQTIAGAFDAIRDAGARLTVVTRPMPEIIASLDGSGIDYRLLPWSQEATWQALQECDAVIIPSAPGDFFAVKSPNRIAEALWAGRHVIAAPIPSYLPFSPFAAIGDLREGLSQPIRAERIVAGQEYVAKHHSQEVIQAKWRELLEGLL